MPRSLTESAAPREVDRAGRAGEDLAALHARLLPSIGRIVDAVHYADAVKPGEEWTIPVALDCDFEGELVVRVTNAGSCARTPRSVDRRTIGARPG
jgi:hypothetical protein